MGRLMITRKIGDRTYLYFPGLAEPVEVQVVKVERGKVFLSFLAPPEVRIERDDMVRGRDAEAV